MPGYSVISPGCFSRQFESLLKKFNRSQENIHKVLDSLKENQLRGDKIPGYSCHLRKLRISLQEYNIGKSRGLRLVFMVLQDTNKIILVAVYHKGEINNETKAQEQELVRRNLKSILNS